jgi:hypothetical protein
LKLTDNDLEVNENIDLYSEQNKKSKQEVQKIVPSESTKNKKALNHGKDKLAIKDESPLDEDFAIDFTTSSAISRVNIKFLAVYIPVLWLSGILVAIYWYEYTKQGIFLSTLLFLPFAIISMLYLFMFACLLFSKLLIVLVNLIHRPKEGVFKAEIGDADFEFWCLRIELKKLSLSLFRNSPIPWGDALVFKWLGLDMDLSSHLHDAWLDPEFIEFGRRVLIGQGAVVQSSMVVGKYLIIKKSYFDDYVMVGGQSTIAPGTIIGKDSLIGAICTTTFNQVLEPGWIYFGIPAIKLKENKYAEKERDVIIKRNVDDQKKFEIRSDINIDEDKKKLIKLKFED